jgi:hypothetical protein
VTSFILHDVVVKKRKNRRRGFDWFPNFSNPLWSMHEMEGNTKTNKNEKTKREGT